MKKLLFLILIAGTLVGCLPDDNNPPAFNFEILPMNSYEMPDEFEVGQTYQITVGFVKPNDCFNFNSFFFQAEGNERTIAVIAAIEEGLNCQPDPVLDEASLNFFVNGLHEHYIFKFWIGRDNNGNDMYTIVEVPVVD